jgi:hypothetical protein
MHFLFLFLDGVGLGENDPEINPFVAANMPTLRGLLDGQPLIHDSVPCETEYASLRALDAALGVTGLPQSATGQAALLTGKNVPKIVGEHYGPKPNPPVADVIRLGTLFHAFQYHALPAALLNAYPPGYFRAIESGRRLYSAVPLAVTSANIPLKTQADLQDGRAMAADFTAKGWVEYFKDDKTEVMAPIDAGHKLAKLSQNHAFAFFEYWVSDMLGHKQNMTDAIPTLETLDGVLAGLLDAWDMENGLILITSDHGNMEDMSTRRHTARPVPGLVIGAPQLRAPFIAGLNAITDIASAILHLFGLDAKDMQAR